MSQLVTRRDFSERADRLRTLLIFTVLQAFLLTVNLNLLPMSSEEAGAVSWATPWLKQIGAADPLWSLRLLSALCAVSATILLDRLWLRRITLETRQWFLLLWAFSPAMLLFGRMAQSYSLQTLLTVIAVWAVLGAVEAPSWKRLATLAGSLIALLYVNCFAGAGVWLGANVLLQQKGGRTPELAPGPAPVPADRLSPRRTLLLPNAIVAAAYLPWIVIRWPQIIPRGLAAGSLALLRPAFSLYSLAFGEAIPVWVAALSAILIVPYLCILTRAARNHPLWLLPAVAATLLGSIGAAFAGSHLLFLLPVLILAVASGIEASGRLGALFCIALFAANAGGVWYYFGARDFINVDYMDPQGQIAKAIVLRSTPAETVVWTDGESLRDLPANFSVRVLRSAADADAAWNDVERNPAIRHVWFIRRTDAFEAVQRRMVSAWHYSVLHLYVPTPETYRLAQKFVMRVPNPPRYLYQVWEFRR